MTFQLVTAKFSVIFDDTVFKNFIAIIYKNAALVGLLLGILMIVFSAQLQHVFNTSSSTMFTIFGVGVPLYFLMSVNRGIYQGTKAFKKLSITYQLEMWSRLIATLILIFLADIPSSAIIAIGIFISFGFGLIPFKRNNISFKKVEFMEASNSKLVRNFFIITAFYELTQIIINNSDILLVKHYFPSYEAGLYASLALIGRVVYFIAWMFVMLLLPTVVALQKEGKPTAPILLKYVVYIASIASTIVVGCALFPETVITLLFGDSYIAMAPLLWQYATATGLFAVSNIFAYYYLSLDRYIPVVLSGIFGMLQVVLVIYYHTNLQEVVQMQMRAMLFLLFVQLMFFYSETRQVKKTI